MDIIKTYDQLNIFLQIVDETLVSFVKKRKRAQPDFCPHSIRHAFHFLRSFIYVQIEDKKVRFFQPFCNTEYENVFDVDKMFNVNVDRYYADKYKTTSKKEHVLQNKQRWWMNGRMVCNVPQKNAWNTTRFVVYKKFLKHHVAPFVSDCCFILNPRDHPLVKNKVDEFPYDACILKETYRAPTMPVFSHYINKEVFADMGFPTIKDLIKNERKKTLTQKNMAVFRGSATGAGIAEQNQRIMLCLLATRHQDLLDCKLTAINQRDRICPKTGEMCYLSSMGSCLDVGKHNYMSEEDQQKYKYSIVVDGWSAADRVGSVLGSGSLMLLIDPMPFQKTKIWFYDKLQEDVHYVRVYSDLSNLVGVIETLNKNPKKTQSIVDAASVFFDNHLSTKGMAAHVIRCVETSSKKKHRKKS